MNARGVWPKDVKVEADVAHTIHELFQALAWSDRTLHDSEYKLWEAALEEDKLHGGYLATLVGTYSQGMKSDGHRIVCLEVATQHDKEFGTTFTELLINHLRNLGLLILMADKRVEPAEIEAYEAYFQRLKEQVYGSTLIS